MGRLLAGVGVVALILLAVIVLVAMDNHSKRRKQRIKQLQGELKAATDAIDGVQAEAQLARDAHSPIDSVVVHQHLDEYHARVRELYRKDPRS